MSRITFGGAKGSNNFSLGPIILFGACLCSLMLTGREKMPDYRIPVMGY